MSERWPVKITVLKQLDVKEMREKYGNNVEPTCKYAKLGNVFLVQGFKKPEGFCDWAWSDIFRDVVHLALGGDFYWIKEKGTIISCCTDGLRPVLFKLERMEK